MKQKTSVLKNRWVKLIFFTIVFGMILSYASYIVSIHYIYGQTCFTTQTVASDSRCLFILSGKVYEKGTRASPHQGNTCGTDVTNIIPSFHAASAAVYLDPNYVGNICVPTATPAPTSTPKPTNTSAPQPTATPTPTPTSQIQPTYPPNCSTKTSGDADCNNVIDSVDYEIWRKEKMHEVSTHYSDFNSSGVVDMVDFEIWRKTKLH